MRADNLPKSVAPLTTVTEVKKSALDENVSNSPAKTVQSSVKKGDDNPGNGTQSNAGPDFGDFVNYPQGDGQVHEQHGNGKPIQSLRIGGLRGASNADTVKL